MFDLFSLIKIVGLIGIFVIIFLESGVFFGFFLPGDSLLFTAGIFAKAGYLNLEILIIGCILGAILGHFVGYWTGKYFGRKLLERESSFFFRKDYMYRAEHFYNKNGSGVILLARFIPIIRTFAPIVAGIGKMNYKTFVIYNIVGGIFWVSSMTMIGYFIGSRIPNVEKYLFLIVLLIIFISVLPLFVKKFDLVKKYFK